MIEKIYECFPFKNPRKGQIELIEKIIKSFKSGKKHVILNAPTGWGKSVIAYTIIKYFGDGYILTSQKCLQEQYHKDLDIPYILGRNNYICSKNALLTCEMGICKRNSSKYCNNCQYLKYRNNCFSSLISNMNYNYFLTCNNTTKVTDINDILNTNSIIPNRNIIVCDECHNFENELINLCSLKLSDQLLKYLSIPDKIPNKNISDKKIFEYLFNKLLPSLTLALTGYKNQINGHKAFGISKNNKEVQIIIQKYITIKKIIASIKEIYIQYNNSQTIIINKDNDMLEFKLLYANNLFNMYVEKTANKFLHMSATILNKEDYCRNLGLNKNDVEYISVEAMFPRENRLIHYLPIGSMSYLNKEKTIPYMVNKIEELLKKYKNNKGIIHTTNYNIAQIIIEKLKNTDNGYRLVMPRGSNRQEILNEFYKCDEPLVLISPSLTEGLDLKDDLSRFCIICKVPYASLADPWVKARMEKNNMWYTINAAQTLIQMTGRSIRSETDFCDTYILDSNFIQFAKQSFNILPDWWKDSVIEN